MKIEELQGEKMKVYRPIFIDRRTGQETEFRDTVHLFPSEVIGKQIEQSTAKTVVVYREV